MRFPALATPSVVPGTFGAVGALLLGLEVLVRSMRRDEGDQA